MYEYHGNKGSRRQQEIKKPLTLYRAGGFLFISCRRYQTDHLQIYSGGVRILNVQLGEYDPETGDYREDTIQETKRLASVMNTGEETLKLLYGSIKQGSLTIQLQNHYNAPFSRIRIGETVYQVDVSRKLRVKHTFIVSEVQGCQK